MFSARSRVVTAAAAVVVGLVAVGCQNDHDEGTVHSRSQEQTVRSDGTAVQTRTQYRETPSGTTVRETQTQERQVVSPTTRPTGTTR
jgi:hypothetical protein